MHPCHGLKKGGFDPHPPASARAQGNALRGTLRNSRASTSGFGCNRLWLLKNSFARNSQKIIALGYPTNVFLNFLGMLYLPNLGCFGENGLFNSHGRLR